MIELFSRNVNIVPLDNNIHLIPLHIADDISSLSAILLNDDYYYFLKNGYKVVDGISVLDEVHLIPFKAKAWCELTERQEQGEIGLSKHIKKHKYDIAQLLSLIARNQEITLEGQVYLDMMQFIIKMKDEEIIHPNLKTLTSKMFCERLSQLYNIKCDVF